MCVCGGGGGGGLLLRISSNRDDEMEAKSKLKEICGPKIKPPKSSMPNFRTLKKVAKQIWLYFICRTTWPRDTWVPPQIFRLF